MCADRTILSPANANSLNGLFNGTTPISVSTLTVGFPPNDTVLSSNAPDSLIVAGTLTTTGGITAESGVCQLGLGASSVILEGTTGVLDIDGTCNAKAFGVTNGANSVSLQCLSPTILTVGGSIDAEETLTVGTSLPAGTVNFQLGSSNPSNYVNMNVSSTNPNYLNVSLGITTGTIIANSFSGGIVAGTYNIPTSVGGNSGATITFPVTFNPVSGWNPAYAFPQFTLTTSYGIGISGIGLSKSSDTTLTVTLDVYNAFANAQSVTSVNFLFVYQPN